MKCHGGFSILGDHLQAIVAVRGIPLQPDVDGLNHDVADPLFTRKPRVDDQLVTAAIGLVIPSKFPQRQIPGD
jgi:hypothetical protein